MPNGPSHHQTRSFLMRRFEEAGIRLRTGLGQNFLVDPNLQRLLLKTAQLSPDEVVLEIGTGTGSLTILMASQAAAVITVEIDPRLFQLAGEELFRLENVTRLELDALKGKNRLNPAVLEAVAERLRAAPGRRFKLVANLPYNVATPVLANMLSLDTPPQAMTVTIQKELAGRITARPGTKDYGALSIWMQSQCRPQIVRVLPPEAFWPRPKVSSAILQVVLDQQLRGRIADRAFWHDFLRAMFSHRRKVLRTELLGAFKGRLDKPQVDRILAQQRLDGSLRAEQLGVASMLALCEAVRAEVGD
jgi:16S rRNA (adenine1518-N6/adenine1519-N6)-dimethyltransferase